MDPFSGVTALIPIALMLLKAGHELKVFIRALHTAPEDVHHFMDEMISYSIFLRNFHRTVHESGYNLESDEEGERRELVMHVVKQAGIVMKGVKEDIFPIFEAVHAEENPASTSFMTRLKWCSKKSEIANLRRCLSEAKSSAQLLLSMFTYDLNLRNCEVLQTILRPNQLPRSLTTQRVLPDIRPRPQIESSAADLLPVNTGHTSITNSANKSDPTKRFTRNQILSWLGVQKELKEKGEAEESGDSDGVAGYQSIDRPRDRSPAPSMSTSSSFDSAPPDEDGARQRPGGRSGLVSRLKGAICNSRDRRRSRLTRSPSNSTSSLGSDGSLSSATKTMSVRSAASRDPVQRPSRLLRCWPFRQRQSFKANVSSRSFEFFTSDSD